MPLRPEQGLKRQQSPGYKWRCLSIWQESFSLPSATYIRWYGYWCCWNRVKKEDIGSYLPGRKERVTLIVHNCDIAPFSWMGYIVISRKDLEENGREILIHELAISITAIPGTCWWLMSAFFFQWFNPASWLLKQGIAEYPWVWSGWNGDKGGCGCKTVSTIINKKSRWHKALLYGQQLQSQFT